LLVAIDLRTFGADGEHVAFDVEFDRVDLDTGEIELGDEAVVLPPRIERHHRRSGHGAEHLLRETIDVAERVGAHQHLSVTSDCPAVRYGHTLKLSMPSGTDLLWPR